ncbi:MAG: ABC transporter substrate-binding protein [Spirochaetaceae bacterium]|jgi:iron complex transport system substrate-binding protein|nr:ABC transporter substrate-binding protein [Spirochaetaceae bacterium]
MMMKKISLRFKTRETALKPQNRPPKTYLRFVWFVPLVLIIFLSSCAKNKNEDGQSKYEGSLSAMNAKLFSIEYMADGVKLVSDSEGNELLLVPREAAVPVAYRDKKVVRTPIQRAFFMSTTHVGLLLALENEHVLDSIAAVMSAEDDWTIQPIIERFKRGQIQYIPWTMQTSVNIEAVAALKPDMVFSSSGYESSTKLFPKLDELGMSYMEVSEFLEESNEAGLEWIKFFAAFYNLDEEAGAIYEKKCERLRTLSRMTSEIPEDKKPLVAFANVFQGNVTVQGGEATTAKELEKAGGRYFLEKLPGNVNVRISMEEFFSKAKDADILMYNAMINWMPDKKALAEEVPLISEFKSFKNNKIYVQSKGYFMNSAALDVKFEDVVSIFHPELLPDRELTFYTVLPDSALGTEPVDTNGGGGAE